ARGHDRYKVRRTKLQRNSSIRHHTLGREGSYQGMSDGHLSLRFAADRRQLWRNPDVVAARLKDRGCAALLHAEWRRGIGAQNELKYRAPWGVGHNPQAPAMGLDDRAADRQAHSHAAGFRREKRTEYPLDVLRTDSRSTIGDRYHHAAVVANIRSHNEHPRPVHGGHGLDRIRDQVQEHLMQLNPIPQDPQQPRTSLSLDRYPVPLQIVLQQGERFVDQAVDVERNPDPGILPEGRPDALDHRPCPMAIRGNLFER